TTAGIAILGASGSRSDGVTSRPAEARRDDSASPPTSVPLIVVDASAPIAEPATPPITEDRPVVVQATRAEAKPHRKSKPVSEGSSQGTKPAVTRQTKTDIDPKERGSGTEHAPVSPDRCSKATFAPVYNAA